MKAQNSIKKIIATLLSIAVILAASGASGIPFGLNAVAEPADSSGIISGDATGSSTDTYYWAGDTTWSYDSNTKTLTIGGTGPMPDWSGAGAIDPTTNPNHYFFRPWGSRGVFNRNEIEHIVIESGVTSIGSYAFCNLQTYNPELTIEIPDTVTKIGRNAFYATYRLKTIVIPDSVKTIDREAFWHSKGLENVTLSNTLEELGEYVFCDCAFSEITIPESVKKISNYTFKDCKNLKTVEIPENVTALGWGAFSYCFALEKVTFKGTTTIPTLAISQSSGNPSQNVFVECPCVADGVKGLIIESCAYLEGYQKQNGWSEATTDYKEHIDKTHHIYYTAEGAVITETCTNDPGCGHTATATLSIPDNKTWFFYDDGNEIKPVINTYSDNWIGTDDKKPADTEIQYANNIKVGDAEATLTITNDDGTPATSKIGFEIVSNLKIQITADGWEGVYDGNSHSITLKGVPDDATVIYGTEDGVYDLTENPAYENVGEYTVYYQVTLDDGSIQTGSAIVKITPKPITDSTVKVEVTKPQKPGDKPQVTVKDGDKTLTPNKDYTVTITETVDTTTGKTIINAKVTGIGNYKDNVTNQMEMDSGNKPGDGGSTPGGNQPGGGGNTPGGNTPGGGGSTSGGNTSDDSSDTSDNNDTSDDSSTDESNNSNKPIRPGEPGDIDEPGNVSGDSGTTTPDDSKDGDNQNPITGNPMGKWVWILLSAAGATGIAVMKSKSNRKKN